MAGPSSWLKAARGLLVAVVLAFLASGASVEGVACLDEAAPAAADQAALAKTGGHPGGEPGGPCTCAPGACHCHHGSAYMAVALPTVAAEPAPRARHAVLRSNVRDSDLQFGLKRPPRA